MIKCLQVEEDSRYQTCLELLNDLSLLDGTQLDWKYHKDESTETWYRGEERAMIKLVRNLETKSCHATKGAKQQRITEFCVDEGDDKHVKHFLERM